MLVNTQLESSKTAPNDSSFKHLVIPNLNTLYGLEIGLCPVINSELISHMSQNICDKLLSEDILMEDLNLNADTKVFSLKKSAADFVVNREVLLNPNTLWKHPNLQQQLILGWKTALGEGAFNELKLPQPQFKLARCLHDKLIASQFVQQFDKLATIFSKVDRPGLYLPSVLRCMLYHL